MLRPRRLHVATLMWLALALLPLRGLALAVMAQQPPAPATLQASAEAQPLAQAPVQHPCHDDSSAAPADAGHAGICHLCDLCHSAMATPQALVLPARPAPAQAPAWPEAVAPPAGPGGGIYKPPRR